VKKLFIALILLAIAATARAEIGKSVNNFIKSPFYREIELSFYYRNVQTRSEGKCAVEYFLSDKSDAYYMVELVRKEDKDEKEKEEKDREKIRSQSIQFPDNPAKWDLFTVSGFVDEAIGKDAGSGALLAQMFKEIPPKARKEKSAYSEKNLNGYKITLKMIPVGDWKITITEL
jgi:hypothetical protein